MFQQDPDINLEQELKKEQQQPVTATTFSQTQLCPMFKNLNPQEKSSLKDLVEPLQNRYQVRYSEVIGIKISLLNRFKILRWIQIQADKQNYPREVFALTTYYIDLYFQKQTSISLQNIQITALGALLLATKIIGVRFPHIGGQLQKQQIFQAEKQICLILNYYLNPNTYVYYLDLLTEKWDQFVCMDETLDAKQKYLSQSGMALYKFRVLYQRMEYINMFGQSFKYPLPHLVFNLFFIQNSLNLQKKDSTSIKETQLKNLITEIYQLSDKESQIFVRFAYFCGLKEQADNLLNEEIGIYLIKFLQLPIDNVASSKTAVNFDSYRRMQTISTKAQQNLQKMIKSLKSK